VSSARPGKVAVVGAGLIGRAWAIVFARGGHPVALYDASATARAQGLGLIQLALDEMFACGLIADPAAIIAGIAVTEDLDAALRDAVHAQESISEDVEAKRALFERMDASAPPGCVLASSSSFIPSSRFSEHLAGRARCLIAHPVNPPHVIPIVELVPAPWTDAEIVERTRTLFASVGGVPIVVRREIEGFVLNRLQAALLNEAFRLVEDGYVSAEDVDKTIRAGLGRRWALMGPFETIDLNAPGGLGDYARRYGAWMFELARQQAHPRPWSERLIAALDGERRKILPLSEHPRRQAWRDRRLMELTKNLRDEEE
jgi:3-hydroxyacyl-CoA dehydrogenase